MARSIVSSGTDASRAFWYIVRNDALVSTSPPPSRAATSTWRMSLAKTLARALSLAPLRCLVVAHFEWPDIIPPAPWGVEDATGSAPRPPRPAECPGATRQARRRLRRGRALRADLLDPGQ